MSSSSSSYQSSSSPSTSSSSPSISSTTTTDTNPPTTSDTTGYPDTTTTGGGTTNTTGGGNTNTTGGGNTTTTDPGQVITSDTTVYPQTNTTGGGNTNTTTNNTNQTDTTNHGNTNGNTEQTSNSISSSDSTTTSASNSGGQKDPAGCNCPDPKTGKCTHTDEPIRMFDGKIRHQQVDLHSTGIAGGWMHARPYNNQMKNAENRGNGWNWEVSNWPYIQPSPHPDSDYALMGNSDGITWFKSDGSGGYETLHANKKTMTHDTTNGLFIVTDPDGTVTELNDGNHTTRPWIFHKRTTPGGKSVVVTNEDADRVVEAEDTVNGVTVKENFVYLFYGSTHTNAYQIQRVTMRRKVGTSAWEEIEKVEYEYYNGTESHGLKNDLKTVKIYKQDGGSWSLSDTSYYRYWTTNSDHLLKYIVEPELYQRMTDNSLDPLTASDALLSTYADHYFEYNGNNQVSKETVKGGSRTFTLAYYENPLFENQSSTNDVYNIWKRRSTVTYPDGHKRIVYSCGHGFEIFRIDQSADETQEWMSYTYHDQEGRILLQASPSAVTGYDEAYPDLVGLFGFSTPTYLNLNSGLYEVNEFYDTTGSGAAYGYLKSSGVNEGYNGTVIKLRELEYGSGVSANGATVYPVSKEIIYPDASDQTKKLETAYSYT